MAGREAARQVRRRTCTGGVLLQRSVAALGALPAPRFPPTAEEQGLQGIVVARMQGEGREGGRRRRRPPVHRLAVQPTIRSLLRGKACACAARCSVASSQSNVSRPQAHTPHLVCRPRRAEEANVVFARLATCRVVSTSRGLPTRLLARCSTEDSPSLSFWWVAGRRGRLRRRCLQWWCGRHVARHFRDCNAQTRAARPRHWHHPHTSRTHTHTCARPTATAAAAGCGGEDELQPGS